MDIRARHAQGADAVRVALVAIMRARRSDFERPRYVVFTDDLPRTGPTRKGQQAVLTEPHRELARAG